MYQFFVDVVKKVKKAVRPRTVKSVDEVSLLFKKERATSVTIEPACYTTLAGLHKITVDYIGVSEKKTLRKREVLRTIEERNVDERLLMQEMKKLFPSIKERAEKLKKDLGIPVTIPEQFVRAFTAPSHATTSPGANA